MSWEADDLADKYEVLDKFCRQRGREQRKLGIKEARGAESSRTGRVRKTPARFSPPPPEASEYARKGKIKPSMSQICYQR